MQYTTHTHTHTYNDHRFRCRFVGGIENIRYFWEKKQYNKFFLPFMDEINVEAAKKNKNNQSIYIGNI